MRCPKCAYLSFEPEPKCRNCGYDFFALTDGDLAIKPDTPDREAAPASDLVMRPAESASPAPTLGPIDPSSPLDDSAAGKRDRDPAGTRPIRTEPLPEREVTPRTVAPRPTRAPTTTTELPLFVRTASSVAEAESPSTPAAPRSPLSVRRGSGEGSPPSSGGRAGDRKSARAKQDLLDGLPADPPVWATVLPRKAADLDPSAPARPLAERAAEVRSGRRLAAAAVDAAILGGIDVGVVWLTLRVCSLTLGQASTLPWLPLFGFFVLLDLGYLLMFTATSGQTVGKMAAGIRVVGLGAGPLPGAPVTMRQAIVRALVSLPSALALGAGFVPALLGRGPAIHDRVAHTCVVPE